MYMRSAELKSKKAWVAWCKGGHRPSNIPSAPDKSYRDKGWVSWFDWLGFESQVFLPFEEARTLVHQLKLKSKNEWEAWRKGGHRPAKIPSAPARTYRDQGWVSMPDWLGGHGAAGTKRRR